MDEHEKENEVVSAALVHASEPGRRIASTLDLAPVLSEGCRRRRVASRRKRVLATAGAAAIVIGAFLVPLPHLHFGTAAPAVTTPRDVDKFALLVAADGGFTAFSPTGQVLERISVQVPAGWHGATLQGFSAVPGSQYLYASYLVGSRSRLDEGNTIIRVALRGGAVTVLGAGSEVALSPDARELAWLTVPDADAQTLILVVRDLETGVQHTYQLPHSSTFNTAEWGPIAFTPGDNDVTVALDGITKSARFAEIGLGGPGAGGTRFLVLSPKAGQTLGGSVTSVSWLPDGHTLVIGAANCVDPAAQCPAYRPGPALAELDTRTGALENGSSLPSSTVSSVAVCPSNGDVAVAASTWPGGSAYGEEYVKVLGGTQIDLGTSDLPFVQWVALPSLGTTTVAPGGVLMPDVVGRSDSNATAVLAGVGLKSRTQKEGSYVWALGTVISTAPAGGSILQAGDEVTIVVSGGVPQPGPATTTTTTH
jgi:hypothetical protein